MPLSSHTGTKPLCSSPTNVFHMRIIPVLGYANMRTKTLCRLVGLAGARAIPAAALAETTSPADGGGVPRAYWYN